MSKKISGAEYAIGKIFSSDFEYHIPSYQRPYAWTVDQADELFEDLYSFYQTEKEEGYFLGSLVLIKTENEPKSEVIDGQQRLTTLTILLAAIADHTEDDDYRKEIESYIVEPGKKTQNIPSKPRLTLRDRDNAFFKKYIQDVDFPALEKFMPEALETEAQQNIRANALCLRDKIQKKLSNSNELEGFVNFLVTRCYLVAVSTPNQQSAFRVFSVMNSRGLDLQPTDIIKADVIGQVSNEKQRDELTQLWEDLEVQLGRSTFNDLFSYIRMIYAKDKAKRSILEEFKTHVLQKVSEPQKLIKDVIEPYADALAIIKNANYKSDQDAKEINTLIKWLKRVDNSDWIPTAILFLSQNKNDPQYVAWFFNKLERLTAYLHICSKNVNQRIDRYATIISALEKDHDIDNPVSEVDLKPEEVEEMKATLQGDIYLLPPRKRSYVILRLDSFLSDGAAVYDPDMLTIEHVLPQTVDESSQWQQDWPVIEDRQNWVHKISNLVPLNRRRNSQAQNYDFKKKKTAYFVGKDNVSSYVLTTQVINADNWDKDFVEKRQNDLLQKLYESWDLKEAA